jgi:hypothetical protein
MERIPTVKLLLNDHDKPNQVIRPGETIILSVEVDPPATKPDEYNVVYSAEPRKYTKLVDIPAGTQLSLKKSQLSFNSNAPSNVDYHVRATVRGAGFEIFDEKVVYLLERGNPSIEFDEQVDTGATIVVREGQALAARATGIDFGDAAAGIHPVWETDSPGLIAPQSINHETALIDTAGASGSRKVGYMLRDRNEQPLYRGDQPLRSMAKFSVEPRRIDRGDVLPVALQRSSVGSTRDKALWSWIRHRTNAIGSNEYMKFIDRVLCSRDARDPGALRDRERVAIRGRLEELNSYGVSAYEVLKATTEIFLLTQCGSLNLADGFDEDEEASRLGESVSLKELEARLREYLGTRLPYLDRVIRAAFPTLPEHDNIFCGGLIRSRVQSPCFLELIWSYWHEEGMLVQSINAVSRRFQNVRGSATDPLAHLEIDPLRPLNNILWGYIQDEWNRLSVQRRAYEYDHHYGLTLYGKAIPKMRPADSRSKFLEAFHNLLHLAHVFYKEDNDTTVIADGYPLLNALKEVHMLLAQGAHNQFGDLPWTARAEMLMQQWLLARPEMRDFLQSRPMVPYKEPWMPQVDTMKTLQGWSDVSVTHFSDLGAYGEQILLSIRYGDWIGVNNENSAKNWARYWRPEIQGYIHAYRAVTGVDLANAEGVDATPPAVHLRRRLALQRTRGPAALPQAPAFPLLQPRR